MSSPITTTFEFPTDTLIAIKTAARVVCYHNPDKVRMHANHVASPLKHDLGCWRTDSITPSCAVEEEGARSERGPSFLRFSEISTGSRVAFENDSCGVKCLFPFRANATLILGPRARTPFFQSYEVKTRFMQNGLTCLLLVRISMSS